MLLGGPEGIPIEGEEFEKSKPKILSIISYCCLAVVAHLYVSDIGGCLAMGFLGILLYYYQQKPTHLSITLALGMSLATLFMSGFIWFSILFSSQLVSPKIPCTMEGYHISKISDCGWRTTFVLYIIDFVAALCALAQLQYVFDSPTQGGPRSFLPRWADYGGLGEWKGWTPFQGEGQRLG